MDYIYILIDLDGTLLDFDKAERSALSKTFRAMNIEPTDTLLEQYHLINKRCWEELERKIITKEELLIKRFSVLSETSGVPIEPHIANNIYKTLLAEQGDEIPHAEELLQALRNYPTKIIAITNGTMDVQRKRLAHSKVAKYFDDIVISEEIGFNKPSIQFFNFIFDKYPSLSAENAIVIGDSPSADILGANNANLPSIWYNPKFSTLSEGIVCDYEVRNIMDILDVVKRKFNLI